jgi:acyl-coenzyme A synthetase/AMP-(fatty) acid ligase
MQFGVSESIEHWGKYRPRAVAVCHNGKVTTYGELNSIINDMCQHITLSGIAGNRVGICIKSKFDFLVSLIGILRVGKSAVLLNTGLPDEALTVNIKDAEVTSFIHDDIFSKRILAISKDIKSPLFLNIKKLTKDHSHKEAAKYNICDPDDEWGVLYSSGTTGIPKGIERDHNSIVTELLGWCLEMGLNRETIFYIGRPIYYTGGLVLSLSTLITCGQLILNDFKNDNDPNEVWNDYQAVLSEISLSWAFFVPDQIRAFTTIAEKMGTIPKAARGILTMGAPISGEEKVKASKLLNCDLVESWGNSESLGTITDPDDIKTRPTSIGRPFLTDELYIVDENCNQITQPDTLGRIAGSEEAGFCQYCNRSDATNRVKQNNLIVSEDIGYVDKDNYFYIRGRQQDCIVKNGETLFKSDIEGKLRQIKSVAECAIAAKDINDTLFELIAVVVPSDTQLANKNDLLDELNAALTPNEQLNDVLLIKSIPRTSSGKTDKAAIDKLVKG